MENNNLGPIIEIDIKGDVGAGKSTICQLIEKALKQEGLTNVTITDVINEEVPSMAYFQSRTKSLRDKNLKVKIRMVQLSRDEVKKLRS